MFSSKEQKSVGFIAHRGGASLAPENTISAIRKASTLNCSLIELDIQRTADNVLILMHDDTVNRTTNGSGKVSTLTWEQIHALDAGSYFSSEFIGEPVPKLEDALDLLKSLALIPVLEVKNPKLYPGIEHQLIDSLRRKDTVDRVVIISFDHSWLDTFSLLAPEITTGSLWWWPVPRAQQPSSTKVISTFWMSVLIDPSLVWRLHKQGYEVWVWTVDNIRLIRLLFSLGVDRVTTNNPNLSTTFIRNSAL
jgi:glycerophosphoryl diester phosphodiesterase